MDRTYSPKTIKILFGRATYCAYPGCANLLVFEDRGLPSVVAEIAHIRSGAPNGPRYDPDYPKSLINEEVNLLLLCGTHHKHVDDYDSAYPIVELIDWKRQQIEAGTSWPISDQTANRIARHYDLANLGHEGFERMCQGIALHVLGPKTVVYTKPGPDGRRDASLAGQTAGYPSFANPWDGYTVMQAIHTSQPAQSRKAATHLRQRIRADLEFWHCRASEEGQETPDFLIFATNLAFAGPQGVGYRDQIVQTLNEYKRVINLRDWALWDEPFIEAQLDAHPQIRYAVTNLSSFNKLLRDELGDPNGSVTP